MAAVTRRVGQQPRLQIHPPRDAPQALRPVPHRVEPGDHRQQHLRGADVGRRLLAPDVLLARLQRQPHRRRPAASTDTPTSRPGMCRLKASRVAKKPHAGRRSPSARRSAAPSRPPRRRPSRPAASAAPAPADRRRRSPARPRRAPRRSRRTGRAPRRCVPGYCSTTANGCAARDRRDIAGRDIDQRDADRPAPASPAPRGSADAHRSATASTSDFVLLMRMRHRHRLGRGGRLVQQRGVGDLHAGQFADHRLEVQQRLQPALRDLRLVRRVGGVPAGVLQHVAQDHRRRVRCRDSPCRSATSSRTLRAASARSSAITAASSIGGGRSSARLRADRRRHRLRRQIVQRRGADRRAASRRCRPPTARYGARRNRPPLRSSASSAKCVHQSSVSRNAS